MKFKNQLIILDEQEFFFMKGETPKVTRKSSEKKTLKRKLDIIENDERRKEKRQKNIEYC